MEIIVIACGEGRRRKDAGCEERLSESSSRTCILDCGRYPVKREIGDRFDVWADIFKEGHDVLSAILKYREKGTSGWSEMPMRFYENDRWTGGFTLRKNTRYEYTIEAWMDNPHTKPFPFWEWVIREVQEEHPDVIFLSEAFTRPKVMKALAKLGFTQFYTYRF
jgi:hypothetical protein